MAVSFIFNTAYDAANGSVHTVNLSSCWHWGHWNILIAVFELTSMVRSRSISALHKQSGSSVEPGSNSRSSIDAPATRICKQ